MINVPAIGVLSSSFARTIWWLNVPAIGVLSSSFASSLDYCGFIPIIIKIEFVSNLDFGCNFYWFSLWCGGTMCVLVVRLVGCRIYKNAVLILWRCFIGIRTLFFWITGAVDCSLLVLNVAFILMAVVILQRLFTNRFSAGLGRWLY